MARGANIMQVTAQWWPIGKFEVTLTEFCVFPEIPEQDYVKPAHFLTNL